MKGPDDREVYAGERETEGRYSFNAQSAGLYSFCFDNSMSSLTSKVVQLDVTVTAPNKPDKAASKDDDNDSIKEHLELLESAISGIASDQKYLKMRQKAHKSSTFSLRLPSPTTGLLTTLSTNLFFPSIRLLLRSLTRVLANESTNQRVILWGFFEIGVLGVMTVVQVLYLRKCVANSSYYIISGD